MKKHWGVRIGGLIAVVILFAITLASAGQAAPAQRPLMAPIGTDFTYQGYLEDGGVPADGTYAMRFSLFNGPESYATQVGSTVSLTSVDVVDGYFTVELDFGDTPWNNGFEMFLEIEVWDKVGLLNYITLEPRQKIGPVPYAVYADYADSIPLGGDGVADTAAHSDHTHFGQTWDSTGSVGLRIVNSWNADDTPALAGISDATTGATFGVFGQAESNTGFAGYFNNASDNGTALYAVGSGADRERATLRVENSETVDGIAAYIHNDSNYETVHVQNTGETGGVLHLQNAGIGPGGAVGGDFIVAANQDLSDIQFRVGTDGAVYSDVGYNCGLSINDGLLVQAPPVNTVWGLNEGYLDACLADDAPADFAEMLPGTGEISVGDVLVVTVEGSLALSQDAYQTTVVGVHSYRPSYLGNAQYADEEGYVPLAMMGVVPVKASAENGAITPGDLLVASNTPGHAMRAGENPPQGTVIGKALSPLQEGTGYIQMIVTLQ